MSKSFSNIAYLLGLLLGLLMSLAGVSPTDAKSNIQEWLELVGLGPLGDGFTTTTDSWVMWIGICIILVSSGIYIINFMNRAKRRRKTVVLEGQPIGAEVIVSRADLTASPPTTRVWDRKFFLFLAMPVHFFFRERQYAQESARFREKQEIICEYRDVLYQENSNHEKARRGLAGICDAFNIKHPGIETCSFVILDYKDSWQRFASRLTEFARNKDLKGARAIRRPPDDDK